MSLGRRFAYLDPPLVPVVEIILVKRISSNFPPAKFNDPSTMFILNPPGPVFFVSFSHCTLQPDIYLLSLFPLAMVVAQVCVFCEDLLRFE